VRELAREYGGELIALEEACLASRYLARDGKEGAGRALNAAAGIKSARGVEGDVLRWRVAREAPS